MRAGTLRLWHAFTGQHGKPLPPAYVLRAHREWRARLQQRWLPYCGLALVLVIGTQWGFAHLANPSYDRFALQLATQVGLVLVGIYLTRGATQPPERILRAGIGMLVAMIVAEAVFYALLPGPTESFTLVVVCYLLSARLLLSGGVIPELVLAATCVVAQVAVLAMAGFTVPVIIANAAVITLVSGVILVGAVVTYTDQVDRLYRREMNRAAFDMARRPASQTPDMPSAVRPITELAGQTLEVTRVEVWLPDDDRTVMRWIDGYDCATGDHPVRDDVPLGDPLDAIGDVDEEPLTHGYDLPAPAGSLLGCPHGSRQVASVLEAAVRVRGKTGVLCLQQEGHRRSWTHDEERFASNLAHLVALAIEARERDRAEAVLQASEQQYRQLFDNAAEVIYAHDLNGRLSWVNRAAEELTGYRRDEMLEMNVLDLIAPEDRAETRRVVARTAQGEPLPSPYEFGIITRGGRRVTLEVSWRPIIRDGRLVGLQGIARNLTERKQWQERLRESEERFRQLMTQAADALYVSDVTGRIVEANTEACQALGYERAELLALRVFDVFSAFKAPGGGGPPTCLEAEPHVSGEAWLRRKDGTSFLAELRISRIDIRGGRHILTAARDITERTRADAALRRAVAELEQRSAELSSTVAMLNEHIVERRNVERQLRESRAQLRALSTRLLQVQEEERRRMAREIHDELGQTLTALRLDVAWLGRRLDGPAAGVHEKLDRMAALIDGTVESVQTIARNLRPPLLDDLGLAAALEWQAREFEARTGISCRLTLEPDEIGVDADRSIAVFRLVQEALTNVARHARATRVTITVQETRGRLLIRIRDNGRGIGRDEMVRAGALGLVGMRERVHLWGGRLRIEGRKGRGTLLRAEIPLLERPPAATGEVG